MVIDYEIPEARKYPRTMHLPFSPGTTSDDRIAKARDVSSIVSGAPVVMTEKLDGENTCLNVRGVFARSHGAPTRNPWASYLWDLHARIRGGLKTLELFGESLYAVHSIKYGGIKDYFFLFAVRDGDTWLPWDEVEEYAGLIGVPTVPVLHRGNIRPDALETMVKAQVALPSRLSAAPPLPPSPTEGVVIRLADAIPDDAFGRSVFKWVRKGHVQTTQHWSKHWQRAYREHELTGMAPDKAAAWLTAPAVVAGDRA
jgi:hypothetical protein